MGEAVGGGEEAQRSALTGTTRGTTGLVPAGTHTGITIIIGMQLSTFATPPRSPPPPPPPSPLWTRRCCHRRA